ncbi:hypothetical protein WOLCODRAFT_164287, partial [Wolfiporia cocos MD-104 SS10]
MAALNERSFVIDLRGSAALCHTKPCTLSLWDPSQNCLARSINEALWQPPVRGAHTSVPHRPTAAQRSPTRSPSYPGPAASAKLLRGHPGGQAVPARGA